MRQTTKIKISTRRDSARSSLRLVPKLRLRDLTTASFQPGLWCDRVQPALCLGLVVDFNFSVLLRMAGVERTPPTGRVILHRLRNPVARGAQSSETRGKPAMHPVAQSCAVGPVPARSFGPSLIAAEQQSPGLAAALANANADAARCDATNPPPGNRKARSCTRCDTPMAWEAAEGISSGER
jgi:hypothetical protein